MLLLQMKKIISIEAYTLASSLLEEIYTRGSSTLTIARKGRIIGKLVGAKTFVEFLDNELNGYSNPNNLPAYRIISGLKTYAYDSTISTFYYNQNKQKLLSKTFISYPLSDSISRIESFLAQNGVFFRGVVIATPLGVDVYEKTTVDEIALRQLLDGIQEKIAKQLEDIVYSYIKKNPPNPRKEQVVDLVGILQRFNDFRKYEKDSINNESDVRKELYKMLKPSFPDLVDEEYLQRFGIKNPKVDFAIPSKKVLLENKFVEDKRYLPKIQDEIIADIPSYLDKNEKQYDGLIIFIYSKVNIPHDFIENLKRQKKIVDVIVAYSVS